MAPSAHSIPRFVAERGFARHIRQRSPLVERDSFAPSQSPTAVSASPSPSQTGPAGVTLPPHGTAALIGIVVTLSIFILGFAGWRICVWRRNKAAAAASPSEKSGRHVGLYDSVHEDYGFKRTLSLSSSDTVVTLPTDLKAVMTRERSPAEFKINLAYQPKVIYDSSAPMQEKGHAIVLPGIKVTPAPPSLQITPPPTYANVPAPAPSPRTVSMGPNAHANLVLTSTKLPRLVIVESTFTATLHDELEIREGETLRLLEEYEDEWCLVQRVGKPDAEKGVVPRFCVIEKPEVATSRRSGHIPRLSSVIKF